jgi:uncharacterized protein YprB with RNaseH-like and TPR domain
MGETLSTDLIKSSFSLFPGIGPVLEDRIWSYGLRTWEDMLAFTPNSDHPWHKSRLPDSQLLKDAIPQWQSELEKRNVSYFAKLLPNQFLWRLWASFPEKFCYLDIETTGIDAYSVITVVSLYIENKVFTFQRGKDLEFLLDELKEDLILVTYNGKRFDVPFIEREFHQKIPNLHLDLMNVLHEMGIKGGLKKSEMILGLKRSAEVSGIDGHLAPMLWKDYQSNQNQRSLDLLIAYNKEDTINLELILKEVYSRKLNAFLTR